MTGNEEGIRGRRRRSPSCPESETSGGTCHTTHRYGRACVKNEPRSRTCRTFHRRRGGVNPPALNSPVRTSRPPPRRVRGRHGKTHGLRGDARQTDGHRPGPPSGEPASVKSQPLWARPATRRPKGSLPHHAGARGRLVNCSRIVRRADEDDNRGGSIARVLRPAKWRWKETLGDRGGGFGRSNRSSQRWCPNGSDYCVEGCTRPSVHHVTASSLSAV